MGWIFEKRRSEVTLLITKLRIVAVEALGSPHSEVASSYAEKREQRQSLSNRVQSFLKFLRYYEKLEGEGKVPSKAELETLADELVDLSPEDKEKRIQQFIAEVKGRH